MLHRLPSRYSLLTTSILCEGKRSSLTGTNTFNYLGAALLLTWVAGASLGAMLLNTHVWMLNFSSVMCYALTAGIATLIPDHLGKHETSSSTLTPQNDQCGFLPFLGSTSSMSKVSDIPFFIYRPKSCSRE